MSRLDDDLPDDQADELDASADDGPDTPSADGIDPLTIAILRALHEDREDERDMSLARLAKRVGARQSTLRRQLTALEDAGVVRVELDDDGSGTVSLTTEGSALCALLMDDGDAPATPLH